MSRLRTSHVKQILKIAAENPDINPYQSPTLVSISHNYSGDDSEKVFRLFRRSVKLNKQKVNFSKLLNK